MRITDLARRIYTETVAALLRPYTRRELPGWGRLYAAAVGDHERDWLWAGQRHRWVRNKIHGYEMSLRIAGWSNRMTFFLGRFYDLPTQLLMKAVVRPGDCVVDIGANEGMMSLLASRLVGDSGQVISFEPSPVPRSIFEANIARNGIRNVEIRAQGVADVAGELELFVPAINTGEASFTSLGYEEGKNITCPVVIADEALQSVSPAFIKIDVEGFEGRVVRGLAETLKRAKPVIAMEMVRSHLARDGQTPEAICRTLEGLGYRGRRLWLAGGRNKELAFAELEPDWRDGDYVWTHEHGRSVGAKGSAAASG
jgi:FkbM family methyltransferase